MQSRRKLRIAVFIASAVLAAVMLTLAGGYLMKGGGPASTLAKAPDPPSQLREQQPGSGANGGAQDGSVQSVTVPASGTTTQPSSPTSSGFRLVEAVLGADPATYAGSCPTTIHFSGRISVAGGSGDVSYRFVRSDGASSPVERLHFSAPGSADVSTTWTLGGPGFKYSGWEEIQIFDPAALTSEKATFSVTCSRPFKPPVTPVSPGGFLNGADSGSGSGPGSGAGGSVGDPGEPSCGKFHC
jgi:hypothetical protein